MKYLDSTEISIQLPNGKSLFFLSDTHFGFPNKEESGKREKRVVNWLDSVKSETHSLFLLGDIFDKWLEYRNFIPKTGIRFFAKIRQMVDEGIDVYFFSGNHDNWWKNYFTEYIGIKECFRQGVILNVDGTSMFLHHGHQIKPRGFWGRLLGVLFVKEIEYFLHIFHPEVVFYLVSKVFTDSQKKRMKRDLEEKKEKKEFLVEIAKEIGQKLPVEYIVMGHRHKQSNVVVGENKTYFNIGEWVFNSGYGQFSNEKKFEIKNYNSR